MNQTTRAPDLLIKINQGRESWLVQLFEKLFSWWELRFPQNFYRFKKAFLHQGFLNLPNLLSFSRGGAVPLLLLLMYYHQSFGKWWPLIFSILIGLTDFIDGAVAKAAKCITDKGSVIDPFMDKLLFISVMIAAQLFYQQMLLWPLIAIAVAGEVININFRIYKIRHNIKPWSADIIGKTKFVLQVTVIYLLLLPIPPRPLYLVLTNVLLGASICFLYYGLYRELKKIIIWKKQTS